MSGHGSLELRDVWKSYGENTVLKGVSMTLSPGRSMALFGATGSGKSTILRILAGIETPNYGQVLLDDGLATDGGTIIVPPHHRGLSMVFQDLALWPSLTAIENVTLGLHDVGLSKRDALNRANEALSLCRIGHLSKRRPGTLSGGEQQRVALARALATHPRYLLLDEPFAGLDLATKSELLSEINTMAHQRETTLILVTHDVFEALSLTRELVVIDAGSIVARGEGHGLAKASALPAFKVFRDQLARLRGL